MNDFFIHVLQNYHHALLLPARKFLSHLIRQETALLKILYLILFNSEIAYSIQIENYKMVCSVLGCVNLWIVFIKDIFIQIYVDY